MGAGNAGLVRFVLATPLYALYGAWVLVTMLARFVRWVVWTARLTKPVLICSACGEANSIHGRWECRSPGCGAIYLGAVDHCERCGAGASMFFCQHCGASIPLGPAR